MTLVQTEPKKLYLWNNELKAVYLWDTKVRPSWPDKDYLCFTAEQASSTVRLKKSWSPTAVNLETSTDWLTWTGYTIWSTLTLSAVGDKIYFRNTSETTTWFSTRSNAYYQFVMTGSIAASWDITSLINKNLTTTLVGSSCFYNLFADCSSLTKCPKLPATTLTESCYYWMFNYCSNLETLPALPATNIPVSAYYGMFNRCSKIKLSTTQTWEYQTPYRIPTEWTWTKGSEATDYMFDYTWWTFIGSWRSRQAGINTTYYTSNTVV